MENQGVASFGKQGVIHHDHWVPKDTTGYSSTGLTVKQLGCANTNLSNDSNRLFLSALTQDSNTVRTSVCRPYSTHPAARMAIVRTHPQFSDMAIILGMIWTKKSVRFHGNHMLWGSNATWSNVMIRSFWLIAATSHVSATKCAFQLPGWEYHRQKHGQMIPTNTAKSFLSSQSWKTMCIFIYTFFNISHKHVIYMNILWQNIVPWIIRTSTTWPRRTQIYCL